MNVWLVNSNSKEDNENPHGYQYMLRHSKASAYYDRRNEINKISPNDLVLLYHNENRVIAVGFALNRNDHDFEDISEVENWIDVNWFWKSNFNNDNIPTNFINRNTLGITMVNGTVINITNQINYQELLKEIGERQNFL